ncbi:hypothetical protein [Alloscardovia sp. HMSC034E08]|uniref:hypothetical protein n=1 Tax=Alloscardovia sp. HMSC034E08 TaxID=1739413 RepID=UPI0011D0BFB5|nr:hypothetical protein [Alloscardovia sp. HMSC034E08]
MMTKTIIWKLAVAIWLIFAVIYRILLPIGPWKLCFAFIADITWLIAGHGLVFLGFVMFDIRLFSEKIRQLSPEQLKADKTYKGIKKYLVGVVLLLIGGIFTIGNVQSLVEYVQDIRDGSIHGVVRVVNTQRRGTRFTSYNITYAGMYWTEMKGGEPIVLQDPTQVEVTYIPSMLDKTVGQVSDSKKVYAIEVYAHSGQLVLISEVKTQ